MNMNPTFDPATRAASFAVGTRTALSLLKATTLDQVADLISRSVDPDRVQNGIRIDADSFREGLAIGLTKVKELVASSEDRGWLSPSREALSEVDDDEIMCLYYGA